MRSRWASHPLALSDLESWTIVKLELRSITKSFGSLIANDRISLTLEPGQIHAILGENGAGKSTLMNVLYGLYQPDAGEIVVDGAVQHFGGPGDAMRAGIGMVHQHFMLIPVFTVAENLVLGNEPTKWGGVLDYETARRSVVELSSRFGFDINPDDVVEDLPVGSQQRVEIIKALVRDANVLVLDEPTAVLTPQETDELMGIMKQLAAEGKSILFITHKLREVQEVADVVTVIRAGKVVGSLPPTASSAELAALMVGRDVDLGVTKGEAPSSSQFFEVKNLSVTTPEGLVAVDDVSFSIRGGEILAIAGVQGNGQTEIAEAIMGLSEDARGSITLNGTELLGSTVDQVLKAGVGYIPEDRKKDGLVGEFTISENLMLDRRSETPFAKGISVDLTGRNEKAQQLIKDYDIRTPSADTPASNLSGGNQQKVVLARELSRPLQLLLASQPTRGVDVGSIEFIHRQIVSVRNSGIPCLIISTELDEVLALADRVAVMYRGRIVGIVEPDTARLTLGQMMAGVSV